MSKIEGKGYSLDYSESASPEHPKAVAHRVRINPEDDRDPSLTFAMQEDGTIIIYPGTEELMRIPSIQALEDVLGALDPHRVVVHLTEQDISNILSQEDKNPLKDAILSRRRYGIR